MVQRMPAVACIAEGGGGGGGFKNYIESHS